MSNLNTPPETRIVIALLSNFLRTATSGPGGNVTEFNSAAILAAIQAQALPTQDQYNLIRYSELGVATTVAHDAPLPVKLSSVTGDINVTAGDLNVHLSHLGMSYDSTRIGDGTSLLHINTDGSINALIRAEDRLARYAISRTDDSTTTEYYGNIDVIGHWYIMEIDTLTGVFLYSQGTADFLTNWTNRTSLVYNEFNNLTW